MNRIAPPAFRPEIFDQTMLGLEVGLTVGDIATIGFESCRRDDAVGDVLGSPSFSGFDAIPVKEDGRIVGVLERLEWPPTQRVDDVMRRLDDSFLVSSDEPLKDFIPLLVSTPYRLVVDKAHIRGIVTTSDVHKLPVRLLVFALVTHLELLMAETVVQLNPGEAWIDGLKGKRRAKFDEKRAELVSSHFDPPLIELTDFCDKRDLMLAALTDIDLGKRKAKSELVRVEELRNRVAHAAGFATDQAEFAQFVGTIELSEAWIRRLSEYVVR